MTYHAKQVGHEGQIWVDIQYLIHCTRGCNRVGACCEERLRAYPHVVVFEQCHWVPFAVQKDVQHVHDVGGICGNFPSLVNPFASHWVRCAVGLRILV